jgi:hypothetical protein
LKEKKGISVGREKKKENHGKKKNLGKEKLLAHSSSPLLEKKKRQDREEKQGFMPSNPT